MLNPILFIYYLDFLGMVSVFTAEDLVTGALHVGKRIVKKEHLRRERSRRSSMMRAISMASRNTKNWKWELSKYVVCCCLFTSPKSFKLDFQKLNHSSIDSKALYALSRGLLL